MDDFRVMYRILKTLERAMDLDEFDAARLSAEALGVGVVHNLNYQSFGI